MTTASSWYAVLDDDGVVLATVGGAQEAVEEYAANVAGAAAVRPIVLEQDQALPAPGHRWDRTERAYVGEPPSAPAPPVFEIEETP